MWSCIFTTYTTEKDSLDSHNNRQSVNVNSICFVHLMQKSKYILRASRGVSFVNFTWVAPNHGRYSSTALIIFMNHFTIFNSNPEVLVLSTVYHV